MRQALRAITKVTPPLAAAPKVWFSMGCTGAAPPAVDGAANKAGGLGSGKPATEEELLPALLSGRRPRGVREPLHGACPRPLGFTGHERDGRSTVRLRHFATSVCPISPLTQGVWELFRLCPGRSRYQENDSPDYPTPESTHRRLRTVEISQCPLFGNAQNACELAHQRKEFFPSSALV
jgi:hypothetical protein